MFSGRVRGSPCRRPSPGRAAGRPTGRAARLRPRWCSCRARPASPAPVPRAAGAAGAAGAADDAADAADAGVDADAAAGAGDAGDAAGAAGDDGAGRRPLPPTPGKR